MKKILALTLAAVMTAGMTTVAFAVEHGKNPAQDYEDWGWDFVQEPLIADTDSEIFVINEDGEVNRAEDKLEDVTDPLEGGDEIAIPVYIHQYWEDGDQAFYAQNQQPLVYYTLGGDFDDDLEIWTDWDRNEAEVSTRFVRYHDSDSDNTYDRIMSVIVTVPDNDSDSIEDLLGTVKVGTTRTKAKNSSTDAKIDIEFAPDGTKEYYKDNFDGDETLEAGATGIVDFDTDAGEIDIEFGDKALFTVDVTGQSRLNLAWNTKFDSEVADLDESVNMDFITFTGNPSFNRTGTMYIYAADDTFLYQVVDGKLEKVDATYNEDYEAWEFRTRTLREYVIADGEIDLEAITDNTDDSSSTTEDGNKANPDTGR